MKKKCRQRKCVCTGTILLLLLLCIVYPAAESLAQTIAAGEVLTLDKAIFIAVRNQPAIIAQAGQVKANQAKVGQAQANFYPQINVASGYSRLMPVNPNTSLTTSLAGMPPGTSIPSGLSGRGSDAYNQYSTTAYLNLVLFDFGRTWTQVEVQKLNTEAAQYNYRNTQDQVIFNVSQAYYSLLAANHGRDVAAETVDNFRNHFERARGYYQAGMKPKYDVTKAEVDLRSAELNQIKAENLVRVGKVNLDNAMGFFNNDSVTYTVADDLGFEPFRLSQKEAVAGVYERRADFLALKKQKEAAQESIRLAQKGYMPTLNGVASYTFVGSDFPLDAGWIVGANLIIPIFSGFSTTQQVAEAKANLEVIDSNERALRLTILLELEQAYIALREAAESRRKAEVAIVQAKEGQDLALERYRSGIGTPTEVTDALVAYANAQVALISAHYEYKIAQARIERAIGGSVSG
jgi:outer membrane protein